MGQHYPFYKILPSLVTLTSLLFGFSSLHASVNGHIDKALIFLMASCFLDLFDGKLARMLNANTNFGKEIDSLSDLICFGVATSFMVIYSRDNLNQAIYFSGALFTLAAAVRLAKFNEGSKNPSYYGYSFLGLPTPSAFGLAITPIALENYFITFTINNTFYSLYMIFLAVYMVSNVPTPSLKGIKVNKSLVPIILIFLFLIIIVFTLDIWLFILILAPMYILYTIINFIIILKRKKLYFENI